MVSGGDIEARVGLGEAGLETETGGHRHQLES